RRHVSRISDSTACHLPVSSGSRSFVPLGTLNIIEFPSFQGMTKAPVPCKKCKGRGLVSHRGSTLIGTVLLCPLGPGNGRCRLLLRGDTLPFRRRASRVLFTVPVLQ